MIHRLMVRTNQQKNVPSILCLMRFFLQSMMPQDIDTVRFHLTAKMHSTEAAMTTKVPRTIRMGAAINGAN